MSCGLASQLYLSTREFNDNIHPPMFTVYPFMHLNIIRMNTVSVHLASLGIPENCIYSLTINQLLITFLSTLAC